MLVSHAAIRSLVVAPLLLSLPCAIAGDMVNTFVDRIVSVTAAAPPCGDANVSDFVIDQTFEPFAVDFAVSRECDLAHASATASHASSVGQRSVFGRALSTSSGNSQEPTTLTGSSAVLFTSSFTVAKPTPYTLVGWVRSDGSSIVRSASVFFVGPQSVLHRFDALGSDGAPELIQFTEVGVLQPGQYTIFGSTQSGVPGTLPPGQTAAASFEFLLATTACLGDLDGDGQVGQGDLARLLASYGVKSGATFEDGDFDADGDVDLADLARFLPYFGTQCD